MNQLSWTKYLKIDALARKIDEGFVVLDQDRHIQFVNSSMAKMLGYAEEEMLGLSLDTLHEPRTGIAQNENAAEGSALSLRSKKGDFIRVFADIQAINGPEGGSFLLVTPDDPFKGKAGPEFYKALTHATPRMAIVDRRLKIRYMNIPLTGFSDEEMLDMSILEGVQPEYRDGLRDAVEAVFEDGIPGSIEISETHKDGHEIWIVLRISPIIVHDSVELVVMTGTDITERVLAEHALRESESKYRSIIEQSLIGIAIIVPDPFRLLFANAQLCEMVGFSSSELQSMNTELVSNLVYYEDSQRIGTYFRNCFQQENRSEVIQVRLNNKSGYQTWVELAAGQIEYQNDLALQVSIVDITQRHEMEEGLIKSEHKVKTLLQSLNDLVIVHDENDCYAETFTGNPSILYTTPENYMGRHILDVLPKDVAEKYLLYVQEVRATGLNKQMDYPLTVGGKNLWFSANMSRHEDKKNVVVTVRDVTKRYDVESTLRRERRIFRELADTFIHADDIDELGKRFLDIIAESYEFDLGVFGLFDSRNGILRKSCSIGTYYENVPSEIVVSDDSTDTFLVGQVFKNKKSVFISDVERELPERPYLNRIFNHGGRSTLAFPILDERGEVLGIASFASQSVKVYSDDEKELFSTIANMLGTAIEQKTADIALKMSERRYRELLTNVSEGVGISDLKENILFANRAFSSILSYSPEELVGKNLRDIVDPNEIGKLEVETAKRLEDIPSTYEISFVTRNDEKRLCRISAVPIRNNDGTIDSAVAIVTDITEQVKAEEALRESEVRFRSIFETTPVGMHLHELSDDGQLILTDANRAADIVLRTEHDQLIGKPIELALPERHIGSNIIERYYDVMRTGIPWNTEELVKRNGKVIGGLQIQVFRTSPRTMVTSFLDISERIVAEMEVRKLNEELSQRVEERTAELAAANKELEAFAYSVSHDLRAPLRTIDGFSQALIEDYSDRIDETGIDYLRRLRAAANRMSSLIEDILGLSRVTRGDMERGSVDLSEIAREIVDDLRGLEPGREIEIVIADGMQARCDRKLMKVALQNLLWNAWKFTRNVVKPKIEFSVEEFDGKPAFVVRDNGAGFDMKYKERLFTPFQRLHQLEEFEGSGIGLATVQRIMNRHGGLIWAEGKVNEGAAFYFTLPDVGDGAK